MLSEFLNSIHPVEESILKKYTESWRAISFPRKTIITAEGETQKNMYFVLEGIQKSYFLYKNKEHIMAFTYPPSFSGVPDSFFTQSPSKFFLETITPSKMLKLSYEQHNNFLKEYPELNTLFRKGTEFVLSGVLIRHAELMAYDIETRFKNFMQRSPHLLNQIPRKDLAAYLRIDPTNFSKLINSVKI